MKYTLIIPTFNEEKTVLEVIQKSKSFVDEIIIADDNSTDETVRMADEVGAKVIRNSEKQGQEFNIANAIPHASGEVIITMDADLEHDPSDIPKFKESFDDCDLLIGKRETLPRKGERVLGELTKQYFGISDPLCGFKMFRKELVEEISFAKKGYYCLDFTLQCAQKKKVKEIPIKQMPVRLDPRNGPLDEVEKKLLNVIKYAIDEYCMNQF